MKKIILSLLIILCSMSINAQGTKYQLSSHILDITKGQPAPGVTIVLSKQDAKGMWVKIDQRETDENGRVKDFLKESENVDNQGIYKLTYLTEPYFHKQNISTFYPFVEVVFEIKGKGHFHVPITLSPYGYSTYRGN